MASLDFAYDLLERLNDEKMSYTLVVLQKGKKRFKADIFHNVREPLVKEAMSEALGKAKKHVKSKTK